MLMYGSESHLVTAEELARIPTPRRMGRFHQPVGFHQFMEVIRNQARHRGIEILQENYALSNDLQTFFGTLEIGVEGVELDAARLVLGVRGSHNQKVPRGICLGNSVIVCDNLMFNGDLGAVSTKQTTNVWQRLPLMVGNALMSVPGMARREKLRQDKYRQYDMKPRWGDALLVECHRRGALSGAQLTRAIAEWDEPSYPEHAEDGFTAWRALNAITEVQKPTGERANMDTVRERTSRAVAFLDEVVGV